ncbi:hypothetical protein SAMN05216529_105266 [Faecalicatena contorta]|uniref:Uncharacterized protein n=1 Tax=Faecalicatena contorta TaxID=39482 RepID=A0A315ZY50_9FIRM|nr:hypothetical protein A8805_105266 [Faecalicatena contorta]SUQ14290.1 hypothetical protein SAMN05216529_105266 [Faecalicatena contorta]
MIGNVVSYHTKTRPGIALGWQRRCRYRDPTQAENLACKILSYIIGNCAFPII